MHRLNKIDVFLITAICSVWVLCCTAFAGEGENDLFISKLPDSDDYSMIISLVGTDYNGEDYAAFFRVDTSTNPYALYVWRDFSAMDFATKNSLITNFVLDIQNADISALSKQAIYNSLSENLDDQLVAHMPEIIEATSADVFAGIGIFAPFQSTFGFWLGIGVLVIMFCLVASTIIDLVYIGTPRMVSWMLEDRPDGKKRISFITPEAQKIVNGIADGSLSGSPYAYYLKKRFVTYIVLGVCLLYLLSGQIGELIRFFLRLASGITGVS